MDLNTHRSPRNGGIDLQLGRRLVRRFPIDVELEYKLISRGHVVETGQGRTVNISSGGILFESRCALPPGMFIELSIAWPARLRNTVALKLHATGLTVRGHGKFTAVTIRRHMFRTTGTPEGNARDARDARPQPSI